MIALFACLIIRTFQLVFSARTVLFSHNKSAGTVFQLFFNKANGTDKDSIDTRQTQSAFDEALEIRAQITEDDSAQADVVNTNCNDQRKETTPL